MLIDSVKKFNNLKLFQKYFFEKLIIFLFMRIDFIFVCHHFELDSILLFWRQICHKFLNFMRLLFDLLHYRLRQFLVP
jgi:hypothetical protein